MIEFILNGRRQKLVMKNYLNC